MRRRSALHLTLPVLGLTLLLSGSACQWLFEREGELPTAEEVLEPYGPAVYHAAMRGNVAELSVRFTEDMKRGGPIWARGGPYFFLFSDATRDLFEAYPGLAAVRAVTIDQDGTEVARATLRRGALNDYEWRQARNLAGRARLEGTERPRLIEEMVFFGEDRIEHRYNPDYAR